MLGSYLQDCLSRKLIFFTGKGGVGKTSIALATALLARRHGKRVAFASWSPLDIESPPPSLEREGIEWLPLESSECFREYALKILRFEKVYDTIFENPVLKTFILAAPGLSQTVIAGKIWDLYENGHQDLLIVDLPASGHAYSFFQSPFGVKKIFRLGFVYKEALKIVTMFEDTNTRLDFVGIPEEMSVEENSQFYERLKKLAHFSFGYLHVNQCLPHFEAPSPGALNLLSPEIRECIQNQNALERLEKESLTLAKNLPLKMQEIPRFPELLEEEILNKIATHMEVL